MRKLLVIVLLLFGQHFCIAQPKMQEADKIAALCKTWGFLKYFHPAVTQGSMDWDSVFVIQLKKTDSLKTKDELNSFLIGWIDHLDAYTYPKTLQIEDTLNYDSLFVHLFDTTLFKQTLMKRFKQTIKNRSIRGNRYADIIPGINTYNPAFTAEKEYSETLYPTLPYRLLALARLWNIIEYYSPYKTFMDKDWDAVLKESIPLYIEAKDSFQYYLAIAATVKEICDTHSSVINNTNGYEPFGDLYFPFSLRILNDQVVVTNDFFNIDSLRKKDGIANGDIIKKIDNIPVEEWKEKYKKYLSVSNLPSQNKMVAFYLLKGHSEAANLAIERDGKIINLVGHRYSLNYLNSLEKKPNTLKNWELITKNIGYLNTQYLNPKSLRKAMKHLKKTEKLILDLRKVSPALDYESFLYYFSDNNKRYFRYFIADPNMPGHFIETEKEGVAPAKKLYPYYKGHLIVLIDEYKQSSGETLCLAMKTLPETTFIGGQTAGANGYTTVFYLPGGYAIRISGAGVYFPDGSQFQRIGIKPDIYVIITLKGITDGRDEILERAIEFANNGK